MALKWAERMRREAITGKKWREQKPRKIWSSYLFTTYRITGG